MHTCMICCMYVMVELTIKCTRPGRCNFFTKHSRAYSLQQCSRLSLRYVYRAPGHAVVKNRSIRYSRAPAQCKRPGIGWRRFLPCFRKIPRREHGKDCTLATITVRTPTKRRRRLWSRAAHLTNLTTSRSEEKISAARQICEKGETNEAGRTTGRLQSLHGPQ